MKVSILTFILLLKHSESFFGFCQIKGYGFEQNTQSNNYSLIRNCETYKLYIEHAKLITGHSTIHIYLAFL